MATTFRSFKDVGIKTETSRQDVLARNQSQLPIGIKTPLELVGGSTLFLCHTNISDQIEDNLRNLLLTNWGERLALYNFGGNLRPLLTEFTNKENFDTEAMLRINTAISKWMPFVTPVGFDSNPDFDDNRFTGNIKIILSYSVPNLKINEKVIEFSLYVI
jgi:phage baseplate assembly protein W